MPKNQSRQKSASFDTIRRLQTAFESIDSLQCAQSGDGIADDNKATNGLESIVRERHGTSIANKRHKRIQQRFFVGSGKKSSKMAIFLAFETQKSAKRACWDCKSKKSSI